MRPYVDGEFTYQVGDPVLMGHFFEKVRRQDDYIIYKDFMPEYISCQYSHLVLAARIHLTEINLKRGEPKIWKMSVADHDRIMETCISITHWYEWKLYATFDVDIVDMLLKCSKSKFGNISFVFKCNFCKLVYASMCFHIYSMCIHLYLRIPTIS